MILILFRGRCGRCGKPVELRVRPDACGENKAAVVLCPNCSASGSPFSVTVERIGPDANWEDNLLGKR